MRGHEPLPPSARGGSVRIREIRPGDLGSLLEVYRASGLGQTHPGPEIALPSEVP